MQNQWENRALGCYVLADCRECTAEAAEEGRGSNSRRWTTVDAEDLDGDGEHMDVQSMFPQRAGGVDAGESFEVFAVQQAEAEVADNHCGRAGKGCQARQAWSEVVRRTVLRIFQGLV